VRKDVLKKLLAKHNHFRSKIIQLILDEFYVFIPDDADITFTGLVEDLQENGFEPTKLSKEIAKDHSDDNDLFYLFITGKTLREVRQADEKEQKSKIRILDNTPKGIKDNVLSRFLSPKSISNISSCSSTLYQETKCKAYWKDKLMTVGVNQNEMQKVIDSNVIQNYKKLYRNLLRFYKLRSRLLAWELLCLSGEIIAVEYALNKGQFTRETKGFAGRNALHYATLSGSVEAMKYAISLGIAADSRDNNGANALHYAALSGSVEAMKYAISLGIAADSHENNGANVLHNAAQSGSVEAMKYAISLGIAADSRDNNGRNALHDAALSGSVEAMKYAISLGLAADSRDKNGRNALHYAALSGSVEAMKYAISLGIAADSRENNGGNALHYAALSGSVEAMKYAISLGIAANSHENNGGNVLHNAALSGSVEAMKYAISLGIAVDSRDNKGADALHYAAQNGLVETMKYAISLGGATNSRTNNGANALHDAALSGSVEAMKYAISLGIAADSRDKNGRNALHYAVHSGSVEAVLFVRRLNSDFDLKLEPTVPDNGGRDAFWHADQSKNAAEIRKILNFKFPSFPAKTGNHYQ
jgi:ankyrin repeat protein